MAHAQHVLRRFRSLCHFFLSSSTLAPRPAFFSHRQHRRRHRHSDMRLLTHNLLACHSRNCTQTSNNFPLQCRQVTLEVQETEYNEAFLRGFLPKLDWEALVKTAKELGDSSLPDASPDINDPMMEEDVLKRLHHVLLEVRCLQDSGGVMGVDRRLLLPCLAEHRCMSPRVN